MDSFGNLMGEICKVIFPINEEFYHGNPDAPVAVCTLSSMDLLKKFRNSEILTKISIVGRLLSENKGIDEIIHYINQNKKIKTIIICGNEVLGHKAGDSLLKLHENGTDLDGRIKNSVSPDPILTVPKSEIDYFRKKITLVNMINETNFEKIKNLI